MAAIFNPRWPPLWIKNGRYYGKNQNFQKSLCIFLDTHKTKVWCEFQPNRTTTAPRNVFWVLKSDNEILRKNVARHIFFIEKGQNVEYFEQILTFSSIYHLYSM